MVNKLDMPTTVIMPLLQTQGNRRAAPVALPKKSYTNKRIERKLVGPTEKLSNEELMESGVYQRFNRAVEKIFDNTEDLDVNAEIGKERRKIFCVVVA